MDNPFMSVWARFVNGDFYVVRTSLLMYTGEYYYGGNRERG
jgi:hypothetical protein